MGVLKIYKLTPIKLYVVRVSIGESAEKQKKPRMQSGIVFRFSDVADGTKS